MRIVYLYIVNIYSHTKQCVIWFRSRYDGCFSTDIECSSVEKKLYRCLLVLVYSALHLPEGRIWDRL